MIFGVVLAITVLAIVLAVCALIALLYDEVVPFLMIGFAAGVAAVFAVDLAYKAVGVLAP